MYTRITAAGHHVTLSTPVPGISEWVTDYVTPWWRADEAERFTQGAPMVEAYVDPAATAQLSFTVTEYPHDKAEYAGSPLLYRRDADGAVAAAQPEAGLAFHYQPSAPYLSIVGATEVQVATATARLVRELTRARLQSAGWHILHASAVVQGGEATLALGDKGAGKTTTALLLAQAGGQLLANDRIFVRPCADGTVRALPWPAAAAIGLGLLDALGLYDQVSGRIRNGQHLHPTQHERVTAALATGSREPIRSKNGRELKAQFAPRQLEHWLGLPLARQEATVSRILLPRVVPGAAPCAAPTDRRVGRGDFFTAHADDRYPDVLGLLTGAPDAPAQRDTVLDHLDELPHHEVILSHDVKASGEMLNSIFG